MLIWILLCVAVLLSISLKGIVDWAANEADHPSWAFALGTAMVLLAILQVRSSNLAAGFIWLKPFFVPQVIFCPVFTLVQALREGISIYSQFRTLRRPAAAKKPETAPGATTLFNRFTFKS